MVTTDDYRLTYGAFGMNVDGAFAHVFDKI